MSPQETIEQRVGDLRALIARYRVTLKQVCDRADLNYDSVRNNMQKYELSHERMCRLEEAAIEIRDIIIKKKKAIQAAHNEYQY